MKLTLDQDFFYGILSNFIPLLTSIDCKSKPAKGHAGQSPPEACECSEPRRGVRLIFTRGHISLVVAFKGQNVTLGLYKCNYSLTRGKEFGAAAR